MSTLTQTESAANTNVNMTVPLSSTFSFTAPFPPTSGGTQGTIKQRRVSLALPSSPKVFPAWSFRDDTTLDSHIASGSSLVPEKKGKMRKIASGDVEMGDKATGLVDQSAPAEKRQRKKWSEEETNMLVKGCNKYGVGNWKAILNDSSLQFDNRSPVDLKDRFRTFFPDAYKQHYPNAKTHLSSKVRSTLPDGSSIFEKTRSKKRRPFTAEEDQALKAGYERHGTVWSTIVKDPVFQQQNRRSTDLRDRFRNAFPHLYQAAGYKPRTLPKKKAPNHRAATDDQLLTSRARARSPTRRRRARTTAGYSYSVPHSTACSDYEDSSDEDDEDDVMPKSEPQAREKTPQPDPEDLPFHSDASLAEMGLHTMDPIDSLADLPPLPDFTPDVSQTPSDMTDQSQNWSSSGQHTPPQTEGWSSAANTTAASPASSQVSSFEYYLRDSFFTHRGGDGLPVVGKSAWGPSDWMSANPRMDPSAASSSSSSFMGGPSPAPSSPFSFSQLSHGIMDRYDLFQNDQVDDFLSEVAPSDSLSAFSDPELFPTQSMRGFTHHSNYAGDLIFGARTHQPQYQMGSLDGIGMGLGLGLSGMAQAAAGVNPMQLHTPSLPGIDEIELTSIRLDDSDDMDNEMSSTADVGVQTTDVEVSMPLETDLSSLINLPPQTLEEIIGLTMNPDMEQEMAMTPPATPAPRVSRELHSSHYGSMHSRSMSVPPFEHRPAPQPQSSQQGRTTPQPPSRSFSLFDIPPTTSTGDPSSMNAHNAYNLATFATLFNDSFKSVGDLSDLPFLDLHYYGLPGGTAPQHHDIIDTNAEVSRKGQALDLAQTHPYAASQHMTSATGFATSGPSPFTHHYAATSSSARAAPYHHRGQSAVSPKDLLLNSGNDNKRKRASWDGGPA